MKPNDALKTLCDSLLHLIYPNVCHTCGRTLVRGEKVICLHCMANMPRVNGNMDDFNIVHQRIASTTEINRAAAMFFYHKDSPYASLILDAKYHNRPYVVRHLARVFATELHENGFFDSIDAITPIPLHRLKKVKRGYNQSTMIARGIRDITGIAVVEGIVGARLHGTQTRRGAFQRWENAKASYFPRRSLPKGVKHVLIVDDVMTTGATMLSTCRALKQSAPDLTISVLSLAITARD